MTLWVDDARSMAFSGDKDRAPKLDRARLLALALSVLLLRGGERVDFRAWPRNRAGADYGSAGGCRLTVPRITVCPMSQYGRHGGRCSWSISLATLIVGNRATPCRRSRRAGGRVAASA